MQFKVPQNIDMADRIVGSLTLIQFLYVLIGGIVVYFLFSTLAPVSGTLFLISATPVALFTLAMAFLKVQDQPFPKFVRAFIFFATHPKVRVWHKEGLTLSLKIVPDVVKESDKPIASKKIDKSRLEKLIQVMDTGGVVNHRQTGENSTASKVSPAHTGLHDPKKQAVAKVHDGKK